MRNSSRHKYCQIGPGINTCGSNSTVTGDFNEVRWHGTPVTVPVLATDSVRVGRAWRIDVLPDNSRSTSIHFYQSKCHRDDSVFQQFTSIRIIDGRPEPESPKASRLDCVLGSPPTRRLHCRRNRRALSEVPHMQKPFRIRPFENVNTVPPIQ